MITAEHVRKVWTTPKSETYGHRDERIGISSLAGFCIQSLCQGMGDRGAAGWTNELLARFQTASACLKHTRERRPRRVRNCHNHNYNLAPAGG